jgi:hypothetical protein
VIVATESRYSVVDISPGEQAEKMRAARMQPAAAACCAPTALGAK